MTSTEQSSTATTPAEAEVLTRENTEASHSTTLAERIAEALRAKNDNQVGYQPPNKANHHKTPHRPPHGTRRSMGKR